MKKSFVKLVSAALTLVLGQLMSGVATAAPVVVTPGTNAGYIYFPPASVGGGGTGGPTSLAEGADANASNCTTSNVFVNSVASSVNGSVVLPATVKCIYLEVGAGKGATGGTGFGSTSSPGRPGSFGGITRTVVFNNTGSAFTLSWNMAYGSGASGGKGSSHSSLNGGGGGGAGGASPAFSGPTGLLFLGSGGGGGGGSPETACDGGSCWPPTVDNGLPKSFGADGTAPPAPLNSAAAYVKYAY